MEVIKMGDLTAHFSAHEFTCTCGCKMNDISRELVNMLEKVYAYLYLYNYMNI